MRQADLMRTLVRRASFGATPALENEARLLGWEGFVERQLRPETIDDSELDRILARIRSLQQDAREIRDDYDGPAARLAEAMLWRAIHSKRQLFERIVDVWNDHFAIDQGVGECRILKSVEDRAAIRTHALGRFEHLLVAVTRSAAMLEYLDNRTNRAAAPNENFARELLELHTLGVGEYDERDVHEVARCFTGWTMKPIRDAGYGQFVFDAAAHDDGAKTVLGHALPAGGGEEDGKRVLRWLAEHPATAHRVARKLSCAFVSDEPAAEALERVANVFLDTHGDQRAVMRAVLAPRSFESVALASRAKFQRPMRFVVSLIRSTEARVEHVGALVDELANLGHAPFAWPTPDGYPEQRTAWDSALLARWRCAENLLTNRIDGVRVDVASLFAESERGDRAARADELLEGGKASDAELQTLRAYAEQGVEPGRLLALASCSPSAQEF